MKAWHFTSDSLRDGRPLPANGKTLRHDDDLIMCEQGLHASVRIIDALKYAPGNTICRVSVSGHEWQGHDDKIVCRERIILWRIDGKSLLHKFARLNALDVIHLWDCPDITLRYLKTGNEEIRDAARDAAWAAARDAQNKRLTRMVLEEHRRQR